MSQQNVRIGFHAHDVTGTSIQVFYGDQSVLVDAGKAIGEGSSRLPIGYFQQRIIAVLMTHFHIDHCGDLPQTVKRVQREFGHLVDVFIPEGTRTLARLMLQDAMKFVGVCDELSTLRTIDAQCQVWIQELIYIENQIANPRGAPRKKMNRSGRTARTRPHDEVFAAYEVMDQDMARLRQLIRNCLGERYYPIDDTTDNLRSALRSYVLHSTQRLRDTGAITNEDLVTVLNQLQEIPIQSVQKRTNAGFRSILGPSGEETPFSFKLFEAGHLHSFPSSMILLKNGPCQMVFSGDLGRSDLPPPYSRPEYSALKDAANVLVLESTYGDRLHPDREKEMIRLENIVLSALKNGEDIVFPIISLGRPLELLYEIITRLIYTSKIQPKDVDFYYFGGLIGNLIEATSSENPMKAIVRKFLKKMDRGQVRNLSKSGRVPRIILAGGGFLKENEGVPAGMVLSEALSQRGLNIVMANYYGGPESNAAAMMEGGDFYINGEPEPYRVKPELGQKSHTVSGFSGHADQKQLVDYAAYVIRDGGTIYLIHGTYQSKEALRDALLRDPRIQAKNITVIIPRAGREYNPKCKW